MDFLSHLSSKISFIALTNFNVLKWIGNALLTYIIEHTGVKKIRRKITAAVLMVFMVLIACNVAAAEFYDPNDSNNQANASISVDDHPAVTPGDNGNGGIIMENGISDPASTTQNPEVEPTPKTPNKTIGMQPTGVPLFGFVMAVLMVLGGLAISKRK